MRTDDFNGPKSQDSKEIRPDARDAQHDEIDFNEFDQPLPGQSGSLGDVWRNNPILKLAVLAVGVLVVVSALFMFGGKTEENKSEVGQAVRDSEAPGNETSEAYRDAINEVNQQRLEQAVQTGESTMPIPTASPNANDVTAVNEEPPVNLDDPLSGWRTASQTPTVEPTLEPDMPQAPMQQQQQQPVQPMGPDPQAVDAMAQAMSAQMSAILDKHKINGAQIIGVTDKDYFDKLAQTAAAGNVQQVSTTTPEIKEILIPAGTIVYGLTLTESNTDAPGPVLAKLTSGPLAGSRVLGTFNNTDEYLRLEFNTVVVGGVSQAVQAVAVDPKSTLPAVVTEVDRRYWRRVIFPMAARFIEGMGTAIAQREQTVVVSDGVATSSQQDLNSREELAAGLASGTQQLGQELDREADRTQVMIKVHAGTPIGILFLTPVVKETNPTR